MSDEGQSAKRRRILSSINPDTPQDTLPSRRRSPSTSAVPTERHRSKTQREEKAGRSDHKNGDQNGDQNGDDDDDGDKDTTRPRPTRLRLKDEKRRRRGHSRERGDGNKEEEDGGDRDKGRQSRHHRHHHRHRRRKERSPTPPNPFEEAPLDPDAAFRESLFDAMADDEGADYWASVYGQPVHIYANERATGPGGELERMTDEDYAAHVRQKMWEKTHAGLLEERARREAARKAREKEDRRAEKLRGEVEESLRRGEERRRKRGWVDRWKAYQDAWAAWDGEDPTGLAWPLDSGRREDIAEEAVRSFFVRGLDLEGVGEAAFIAKLKEERVRWHPDKIQQRLGGRVDEATMRDVTATFQIIDRLWSDTRGRG